MQRQSWVLECFKHKSDREIHNKKSIVWEIQPTTKKPQGEDANYVQKMSFTIYIFGFAIALFIFYIGNLLLHLIGITYGWVIKRRRWFFQLKWNSTQRCVYAKETKQKREKKTFFFLYRNRPKKQHIQNRKRNLHEKSENEIHHPHCRMDSHKCGSRKKRENICYNFGLGPRPRMEFLHQIRPLKVENKGVRVWRGKTQPFRCWQSEIAWLGFFKLPPAGGVIVDLLCGSDNGFFWFNDPRLMSPNFRQDSGELVTDSSA